MFLDSLPKNDKKIKFIKKIGDFCHFLPRFRILKIGFFCHFWFYQKKIVKNSALTQKMTLPNFFSLPQKLNPKIQKIVPSPKNRDFFLGGNDD